MGIWLRWCTRWCSKGRESPGLLRCPDVYPANGLVLERRRRDSNPRYPVKRYNTLAGCRLQPLGHSSVSRGLYQRGMAVSGGFRVPLEDVGFIVRGLGVEDLLAGDLLLHPDQDGVERGAEEDGQRGDVEVEEQHDRSEEHT